MKRKFTLTDLMMYVVVALPAVYLALHYSSMPSTIPVHFGIHGPDRYGDKGESWIFTGIMSFVSLAVYFFLRHLPFIDPKRSQKTPESLVARIAVVTVVFLAFIQIIIIDAMRGSMFSLERMLIPVTGIFFCFMGNLMFNVKPNYFVGVRLPWTLENEDNWRATHHLAGKIWFAGGIIIAVAGAVLPFLYSTIVMLAILGVMVVVPCVFSYLYFKKHQ